MRELVIGTRNSKLALIQTNWVIDRLRERGVENPVTVKEIVTKGDKRLDVSLPALGGGGVFLEEIEAELLAGDIDFAVHSLKDIPVILPEGLKISSVPEREDFRDAYLANSHIPFLELPSGSVIGTSSVRRAAQLLRARPDLQTKWIRGPIDSRIAQMKSGDFDAIILAVAGIKRLELGLDLITEYLPEAQFVPAIGQAALAIESRSDDQEVYDILRKINDDKSEQAVKTERAFLQQFENGDAPSVGGYAIWKDDHIELHGMVISIDGSQVIEYTAKGKEPDEVAKKTAEALTAQGALEIIRKVNQELK